MTWVTTETDAGLAVLTLHNEGHRNALTLAVVDDLVAACDAVDGDPSVGAVVLRGAGGYFCSGGDRDELAEICADPASTQAMAMTSRIYDGFLRVGALRMPTIAAIRGGALGAGLNLALAADVRVVSEDAVIASGFLRLGVHPGGGHYGLLADAVGAGAGAALGLFGATIDGRRAAELGFAWQAVPDDAVEDAARTLARHAAADPELARAAKTSHVQETRAPGLAWGAAVQLERAPQMWSFARKGKAGWGRPERPTG